MVTATKLFLVTICSSIQTAWLNISPGVFHPLVESMPSVLLLDKKGFHVKSFGTGDKVKLPGTAPDKPNCYEFGISYEEIYQDLLSKDKSFYTQNGLLHMLDRNRRIKPRPERFQTCKDRFDILVTCEERVYDQVIEALENRAPTDSTAVHVINIDIQDNHEEATIGAFLVCEMVTMLVRICNFSQETPTLLQSVPNKHKPPACKKVHFVQ
ncbi:hypothetical protein PR048_009457 [Dryococelus australis]|uniref:RNA polymerase II subunit A C-terminal domain phosphatase SSU72 n=1 Tax=Dryococelus australis TaxID=614101 RepID=A0ABQ9HZY3_9NEOP|nr:hypothetical protein PR048_009457 [Dryococelus australis]